MRTKESNFTLQAGNYLVRVHLPKEGWTSYWTVDFNRTDPVTYRRDTVETAGAGLRISRITGGGKVREFSYSLAELLVEPVFSQTKTFSSWTLENDGDGNVVRIEPYTINCLMQYSESVVPESSLAKGYLLGYSAVSERVSDGSRSITTDYRFSLRKEARRAPSPSQSTMPVYSNGLMESRTVRDGDNPISVEEYLYDYGETSVIRAYDYSQVSGLFQIPEYRFQWYVPLWNHVTSDGVITQTSFGYNKSWQLSAKEVYCENNHSKVGTSVREEYLYTNESSDPVCRQMTDANILVPVRRLYYADGRLSGGSMMSYRRENGLFLPDTIFDIRLDASDPASRGSYRVRDVYDSYDDLGNPLQVTRDGITSLYVWGYKGQYPVAEITGRISYDWLENQLGSSELNRIRDAKEPSEAQFQSLERIRSGLYDSHPGALMTIWRYRPLVGVSSVTAPNGTATGYSYDSGGRLSEINTSGGGQQQRVGRYSYNMTGGEIAR